MHIARDVIGNEGTIHPPRGNDGNLAGKGNKRLQNAGHAPQPLPGVKGAVARIEDRLALAVISQPPRFQKRRHAHLGQGRAQFRRIIHRRELRRGKAKLLHEALFNQAILCNLKGPGLRPHRHPLGQMTRRRNRHVLEFVSDHIHISRKGIERRKIVIGRFRMGVCHLEGRIVPLRREDMGAQPQPRRGHRQHAPQLTAAENADGSARSDHPGHEPASRLLIRGKFRHRLGLFPPPVIQPLRQRLIGKRKHRRRQQRGVHRA